MTEKQPEAVEALENQEEKTLRPTAVPGGEGEETEVSSPRGKSNQKKGASGSKSSQEQDTPHRLEPQGKTQGMADERKNNQEVTPNDQERHSEPKALGESYAQTNLNPPQGQKETNGDEEEEAPEERERMPERRRVHPGGQGNGEEGRKRGQEQEPSDDFKPRKKGLDRSLTQPPPLRKDHQGVREAPIGKQTETVEVRKDRQGRTKGSLAAYRGEGEETEASTSGGTNLHHQGSPGIQNVQKLEEPQK